MKLVYFLLFFLFSTSTFADSDIKLLNECLDKYVDVQENKNEIYKYASLLDSDFELHIIMFLDKDGSPCLINKYGSYFKYKGKYKSLDNFVYNIDYVSNLDIVKSFDGFFIFIEYGSNYLNQDKYYFEMKGDDGIFLIGLESLQPRSEPKPSKYIKVNFPINENYSIDKVKLSDYMNY